MAEHLRTMEKIVTPEFCEKILHKSEKDKSISVKNVSIGPATNKGDNYTSDMFRISVEYTSLNRKQLSDREKKSFIVKVEPLTEGLQRTMISKSPLFPNEMEMLSSSLVKMNDILGPGSDPLNARSYHTQENPRIMVMEDLMPLGYRMADRQAGLNFDHCLLALRNLGRFHGSSVALCEEDLSVQFKHDCGMYNQKQPDEIKILFAEGTKALAREAATWPELDSKIAKKIANVADRVYQKCCQACAPEEDSFNVINHGDYWVNNMLFKYDDSNKPIGHIFVDFQLCVYASPAVDLLYFFNSSVRDELLVEHEETLLREYLTSLSVTMSRSGCRAITPTLDELKQMMRDRTVIGMLTSFLILPNLLVDKSEATGLDEWQKEDGTVVNPAYKGAVYRKIMTKRLPVYDQMGLFD